MESKLNSVPELQSQAPQESPQIKSEDTTNAAPASLEQNDLGDTSKDVGDNLEGDPDVVTENQQDTTGESKALVTLSIIVTFTCVSEPLLKVSEDERYSKYFKMLRMGVPMQAVKNKMKSEGLDDNILDDPDAPVVD